jgi:hypothetical protein
MHNFKLGDKVYHSADSSPFEVVGIRKTAVEIQGDWSGGTHNVNQKSWVDCNEIQPYDQAKVRYYIKGKPFRNGIAL